MIFKVLINQMLMALHLFLKNSNVQKQPVQFYMSSIIPLKIKVTKQNIVPAFYSKKNSLISAMYLKD